VIEGQDLAVQIVRRGITPTAGTRLALAKLNAKIEIEVDEP
jgi:hypothetical protein